MPNPEFPGRVTTAFDVEAFEENLSEARRLQAQALRHYEELVELLDEQLGTAPAPETSALHERLRAGEEV